MCSLSSVTVTLQRSFCYQAPCREVHQNLDSILSLLLYQILCLNRLKPLA